jgi:hypothetical protein
LLCFSAVQAQVVLTHNGSVLEIDENTGTIVNWTVGGVDHVFEHTYYWRDGDSTTVSLLSDIGAPVVNLFGSRAAEVIYANDDLRITISYLLTGSTNGMTSDLVESVLVESLTGPMAFRLFQYTDYDLNGTSDNDSATRENSSTIRSTDDDVQTVWAVEGGTPIPEFTEISNVYPELQDNLLNVAGYNLDTAAGDGLGDSESGDIAYAMQWNRDMTANSAFLMSTNKVVAVPEPGSMLALGLGAAALLARRRRKKAA